MNGLAMGQQLAWYSGEPAPALVQERPSAPSGPTETSPGVSHAESLLRDRTRALSPALLAKAPLNDAGLYAWWVDEVGGAMLSAGLGHRVEELIYAGQTGANSAKRGLQRKSTLRSRLLRNHLNGTINGSTFRLTLAAALGDQIVAPADRTFDRSAEARLSAWMAEHLTVVPLPIADRASLGPLEEKVVQALDPPLNLQHVEKTPLRVLLSKRRRLLQQKQTSAVSD
jgi:hypothetical protein